MAICGSPGPDAGECLALPIFRSKWLQKVRVFVLARRRAGYARSNHEGLDRAIAQRLDWLCYGKQASSLIGGKAPEEVIFDAAADMIAEGFVSEGCSVLVQNMKDWHCTDISLDRVRSAMVFEESPLGPPADTGHNQSAVTRRKAAVDISLAIKGEGAPATGRSRPCCKRRCHRRRPSLNIGIGAISN